MASLSKYNSNIVFPKIELEDNEPFPKVMWGQLNTIHNKRRFPLWNGAYEKPTSRSLNSKEQLWLAVGCGGDNCKFLEATEICIWGSKSSRAREFKRKYQCWSLGHASAPVLADGASILTNTFAKTTEWPSHLIPRKMEEGYRDHVSPANTLCTRWEHMKSQLWTQITFWVFSSQTPVFVIYLFLVPHACYGLVLSLAGTQALFLLKAFKPRAKSKTKSLSSIQQGALAAASLCLNYWARRGWGWSRGAGCGGGFEEEKAPP